MTESAASPSCAGLQNVVDGRVARPPAHDVPSTQAPASTPRWHACRTRSRFEFTARDQFRAAGIEEFLPTWDETVRWAQRVTQTTRPLFPGYIFVRFNANEKSAILLTRGIVQILSIDFNPTPIPDDVIENLRRVVESPVPVVCCPYVAGAAVTVLRGPFAGVTGLISRVKGGSVLTIPVEILGRAVSVQIEASDVKPADVAKAKK